MNKIYWIEDYLSCNVLENKYYSNRKEAVARRDELGYGLVKSFTILDKEGPTPALHRKSARRS